MIISDYIVGLTVGIIIGEAIFIGLIYWIEGLL